MLLVALPIASQSTDWIIERDHFVSFSTLLRRAGLCMDSVISAEPFIVRSPTSICTEIIFNGRKDIGGRGMIFKGNSLPKLLSDMGCFFAASYLRSLNLGLFIPLDLFK
jgi:hypothetical protein